MRTPAAFLLLLTNLLLPCLVTAAPPSIPETTLLKSRVKGYVGPPLWISARTAADEETVLNWQLMQKPEGSPLHRSVARQRQELLRAGKILPNLPASEIPIAPISSDECEAKILLAAHVGGEQPSGSLGDLAKYSRAVIRGSILVIEPGFFMGVPASLLHINVEEWVRSSKGYGKPLSLNVYYPVAHFRIGPYRFCSGTPGYQPQVGDKILVFDYTGPIDQGGSLVAPRMEQLFFEASDGQVILPPSIKAPDESQPPPSLDAIEALVRRRK